MANNKPPAAPAAPNADDHRNPEETSKQQEPENFAAFRINTDFRSEAGSEKLLVTVPVGRPNQQTFFRVHGSPTYRMDGMILETKEDRKTYLVHPKLCALLGSLIARFTLYTVMERSGILRIWHIRLPGPDGFGNDWWTSAHCAAEAAMNRWIKITSNKAANAYDVEAAQANIADPVWPKKSFDEIIGVAFRGRIIDDINDPVLRRLRGEI